MANPGTGNKFSSVNLNKSYGQQGQHRHHSSSHSSWTRVNNNASGGGANGGGMVVLSRPRSSQKAGPRLSVPPPLNLPSLRKEHEKFDSLGAGSGAAGAGVSGSGMRPSSSGMGWTKPVAAALQEDGLPFGGKGIHDAMDHDGHSGADGLMNKAGAYQTPTRSRTAGNTMEKPTLLRGEDFPSLRATLPAASGSIQKVKDGLHQKNKQVAGETISGNNKDNTNSSSHFDMHSQLLSSRHAFADGLPEIGSRNNGLGSSHAIEQSSKRDDFLSGPLPLVRLKPRSDWADDERDTGHGLLERVKDIGFSKGEDHWDGDFDMQKAISFPHKPSHGTMDRWALPDNEKGKFTSSEVSKVGSHVRDVRIPSREGREGNSWRKPTFLAKEAATIQETRTHARSSGSNAENKEDSKYMVSPPHVSNDYGRSSLGGKLQWSSSKEVYGNEHVYQSNIASKSSSGRKGIIVKETRQISNSDRPYVENFLIKDVNDGWDSLPGSHFGVVKRKKDLFKQTDFHDPVRESFEAELERVQKMQELERQRIIDEQEKALELARREEEERERLARDEEEKQSWLEQIAREAAWKAEQESLEAIRKAEEQRTAREEEKHRIFMEEERRKQAAKKKLLELEERIAKRQLEAAGGDSNPSIADEKGSVLVKEIPTVAENGGNWEDSEKMVDRIMLPASSDSTMFTRPLDMSSGSNFSRDGSYGSYLVERGKTTNNWRRDTLESNSRSLAFALQEQGGGHFGIRQESQSGEKALSRKEFHGGAGFMSARLNGIGGTSEPHTDGFSNMRGNKWDFSDGDYYQKNIDVDSDISENLMHRYGGDAGWAQGHTHSNPYASNPEQYYQNSETDGPYSIGRSRYSMKQPRVLPPPSLTSMHKHSRKGDDKHLGNPSFLNSEVHSSSKTEPTIPMNMKEELTDIHREKVERKSDQETAQRCDSQSSLSVSSAPDSPIHLSHDDLDESGDSPVRSSALETADFLITENGAVESNVMTIPSSGSSGDDADEWTLDNNRGLQEQEEYDEYEEGLKEEDDGREVEDDNILNKELEGMYLKDESSSGMMNKNLGLGGAIGNAESRAISDELDVSKMKDVSVFPLNNREEVESFDMNGHIGQSHLHTESCAETADHASEETKKSIHGMVIESSNVPPTADNLDNIDVTGGGAIPFPLSVPSATILTPQTIGHSVMSSTSASRVATHAEVPFKLQFGLFSGPSLIPTPVPAIQIGSIQMPLNLHPQVSPSIGSARPSQAPLFQFGQLRYTSPIAPGIVPVASKSCVQSTVHQGVSINQRTSGSLPIQDASAKSNVKLNSQPIVSQPGLLPSPLDNPLSTGKAENSGKSNRISAYHDEQLTTKSFSNSKSWERQPQTGAVPSQMVKQERDIPAAKGHGAIASSKGKQYFFKVKDYKSEYEALASDGTQYQRRPRRTIKHTEFRARDAGEKKQIAGSGSSNHLDLDDNSNANERNAVAYVRYGSRKTEAFGSESMGKGTTSVQQIDSGHSTKMGSRKKSFPRGQYFQQVRSVEGNFRIDTCNEDVDAPLHNGVVQIFEQPGIEAPSDDDDFIEVRSKRQMLNDKREQREKEIKAKSRETKVTRRTRSLLNASVPADAKSDSNRAEATRRSTHNNYANEDRGLTDFDLSSGLNSGMVSQPLAPIGTPAAKSEARADIRSQTGKSARVPSSSFAASTIQSIRPNLTIKDKNKAVDAVQIALHSWENSTINQQVMALTQSQLDEAMKPAKFESRVSIGEHSIEVTEHINASCSSTLMKEIPSSSSASPISSLLAGEKIQFGAVTSPTVVPLSSHSVSHGIVPSVSRQPPDAQISQKKLSGTENDCTLFFKKEKLNESCVRLEDCEAAASAVAIAAAAISNDEVVGNAMSSCSVAVSESKTFDMSGRPAGVGDQQSSSSQSRAEPLNVSLPADLSVETPPISLWTPLTTSQSTSNQMLSHFPGGPPPSHFPFYDMSMNTMMGSPVFAFGPNEESASTQPQKTGSPRAGPPHMTWQQCHSVDSFYGPPAGFTGPFISSGGLPGVQGPPHMVVYNHFAPVGGQFGQVGLSFMGTTFIPSGKQPDWKHNASSSSSVAGEGEVNMNAISAQRSPINMPSPIHHLAPGSPLMPIASPVAMFDVSPFQPPSGELPVHHPARWPPLPSSPLQSIPMAMPVLQKSEAAATNPLPLEYDSNINNNIQASADPSSTLKKAITTTTALHSSSSATVESSRTYSVVVDANHQHLIPAELGLESSTSSSQTEASGSGDNVRNSQHQQHEYTNYHGQRVSSSQKKIGNNGSDWPRRRGAVFQGRNHPSFGVEKSFSPSKVKQIYVAKQSSSSRNSSS